MKILMVCPDWFPFSAGLAESCYNTCKQFEKHGHKVRVLVAKDKDVDHRDLNVYEIPYVIRLLGRNPIVFNLWSKIQSHVKWCDVVCLFSYMYEMNSRIVWYRKRGKFSKPIVHFYRGSLESESLKFLGILTRIAKMFYDYTFAKLMFRDVDHIVSNSRSTINLINSKYGVSKKRMTYINNAVDIKKHPVRKGDHKRIIFIGRLIENKGINFFPEIVKVIPKDWKFTVVGDGPLKHKVEALQQKYKNIEMTGKLPHDKLLKLLARSDIMVLPTYAEGSPRAVLEAASAGAASIAFSVGDVPNMIPKGTGFAIKPFEIEEFCSKLDYLIKNDKIRDKMGKSARKFAEAKLDWKKTYPKFEKILKKVVSEYK